MPRYVIERNIPGAGSLGDVECTTIARRSNAVLDELGPTIQWIHSYVTDDRIYCVYDAANEQEILEHAARGGFPADRVSLVQRVINPATGGVPAQG